MPTRRSVSRRSRSPTSDLCARSNRARRREPRGARSSGSIAADHHGALNTLRNAPATEADGVVFPILWELEPLLWHAAQGLRARRPRRQALRLRRRHPRARHHLARPAQRASSPRSTPTSTADAERDGVARPPQVHDPQGARTASRVCRAKFGGLLADGHGRLRQRCPGRRPVHRPGAARRRHRRLQHQRPGAARHLGHQRGLEAGRAGTSWASTR